MATARDPRAGHPDFTPSEREPKILGVAVPKIEEPPPSKRSMWPKITGMQEAGIKVPVSLGFIAVIAGGAFYAGDRRSIDSQTLAAEIKELKREIATLKEKQQEAKEECKMEARSLAVIESKSSATHAEVVQINSKLKN